MSLADPTIEALWKNVVEHWDDDKAHAVFMEHCQNGEMLGEAAARYAGMRGDRDRAANAVKRLEAVGLLAQLALTSTKQIKKHGLPRWFNIAVLLFFGVLTAYALYRLSTM
jgi:hypothetical protein